MWSEALLVVDADHGVSLPRWLGAEDEPWLGCVLEIRRAFAGRPRLEFEERMREPLPVDERAERAKSGERWVAERRPSGMPTSVAKLAAALRVLAWMGVAPAKPAAPPRELRAAIFVAAGGAPQPRTTLLEQVAARFQVTAADVEHLLLSDLASMRELPALPVGLTPEKFARRINHEMAKGFVGMATTVHVEVEGNVRGLLAYAKSRGLIAVVPTGQFRDGQSASLEISGPFSLFHHTALYTRALGGIVGALGKAHRFRLRARVELQYRTRIVEIISGDPCFDEKHDEDEASTILPRLFRELKKQGSLWEVEAGSPPLDANGVLVFPDFTLVHRVDGRRVPVEIGGFWTADTVRARLLRLHNAGLADSYLFCIDDERNCADRSPPPNRALLRFQKHLGAAELLAAVEARVPASAQPAE